LSILSLSLISCAGPYHPFGSEYSVNGLKTELLTKNIKRSIASAQPYLYSNARIDFLPKYQVLHESRTFSVTIKDKLLKHDSSSISFYYNGVNITSLIENISKISKDNGSITYKIKNLTLPASLRHKFFIAYKSNLTSIPVVKEYPFPNCNINDKLKLITGQIKTTQKTERAIERISNKNGINPALMAGLIAQESSFNPKAVSWAKAVGLTQITPLAEKQIFEKKSYIAYPSWNRLPASILKTYIKTGKINSENDWKLNPTTSIDGGVQYLNYIKNYWNRPQNREAIPLEMKNNEDLTSIILASYNSGPSRVKRRLLRNGTNWLSARELKEAKKYVFKVKSYCREYSRD